MRGETLPSKQHKNGADETALEKKRRPVQHFHLELSSKASHLGIRTIAQWGDVEREGGGNVVATSTTTTRT
jgi:hypothetical protein